MRDVLPDGRNVSKNERLDASRVHRKYPNIPIERIIAEIKDLEYWMLKEGFSLSNSMYATYRRGWLMRVDKIIFDTMTSEQRILSRYLK